MAFIQKLGTSFALLGIGWVLELTGYRAGLPTQNIATLTGLRVLVTWLPVLLLCLAIACAALFPITRRVHEGLLAQAERIRLERAASTGPKP